MKILDRLRMWRMCSPPQWADMSTNDGNNGLWARLRLRFPLKNLESRVKGKKRKNTTLEGCVLDLLFCLSTLLLLLSHLFPMLS